MPGEPTSTENEHKQTTDYSPPFIFTQPFLKNDEGLRLTKVPMLVLALTADERTKSRHYFKAQLESQPSHSQLPGSGSSEKVETQTCGIHLRLSRGTVLHHNDRLTTDAGEAILRIVAKPEAVMTAIAPTPLDLLKAAYHLGNRHVELEVNLNYLRFSPDPVLKQMVEQMGLSVTEAMLPFQPEAGAYAHSSHASPHHPHHI